MAEAIEMNGALNAVDTAPSPAVGGLSLEGWLWLLTVVLAAFGTVMIYSASSLIALRHYGDPCHYLKRQAVIVAVGMIVMLAASRIPYHWYRWASKPLLMVNLAALAMVWIPGLGVEFNGAHRWFRLGPFFIQPSEYAKVAWVLYLSGYCTRKGDEIHDFTYGFLPPVVLLGVLAVLLIREPDLGTVVVLGMVTVWMMIAAGVRWRHLLMMALPAMGLGYGFIYREPYRWQRVVAFLDPWTDPLDTGYHLIQSWIALGSGGLWGKGLGAGHQKLFYLPEPFTDFILAVIGEELGLIGVVVLVSLFALLILKGLQTARRAPDLFGGYLALGLSTLLLFQVLINMGVVLGLLPTKGLALPFISYGGSSFTASCLAVGMLIGIARAAEA